MTHLRNIIASLLLLGVLFGTQQAGAEIKTVPFVDVPRFLGTWYQIARIPTNFEPNCFCAQQKLGLKTDGTVSVYNSCNKDSVDGELAEISGFAVNVDKATNAKFSVDFGLPWLGEYWVIGLDKKYRYAAVTDSNGATLYILSKTPTLASKLFAKAVRDAGKQVDTSELVITTQKGCRYP